MGFRPGIVHRIDKGTSGLIVVAKNNFSHVNFQINLVNIVLKENM